MKIKMPIQCPSCEEELQVRSLSCSHCDTVVQGSYRLPVYLQLSPEEQAFVLDFFLHSGSIKEMSKQAGLSYPTMRNRMDDLIEKINDLKTK